MNIPFVDLHAQYQSIKTEIDKTLHQVIDETDFIRGKYVEEFEKNFASALGVKHCIAVGNGTDAITIALKALNIGDGDEVITVANSFIASSEAITNAHARVVFVDCDPDTYNIDFSKIEEKITGKTRAIIPVHLYGQPADLGPLLAIANRYKLFVIEDSAQAHFAEYQLPGQTSKRIGSFGNIATFSFYPGKNLGAYGDAGALVTSDDSLARKIKMLANHGRVSKYDHEFEGYNSRMDGIQGAVLNIKLKYLAGWCDKRAQAAKVYNSLLSSITEVVTPKVLPNVKHVYHLYVIRANRRDELKKFLEENGVSVGIHYPIALPNLTAYKYLGYSPQDFPTATKYENELLSLPIFPEITQEQIEYVVHKIKEFYQK